MFKFPKDARRLVEQHKQWKEQLGRMGILFDQVRAEVIHAANGMVDAEVRQVLADVPVEEINREKGGYRVKTLRDHGILTMADLSSANPTELSEINGISEDGALEIKRLVRQMEEQVKTGVKIRLNADRKTEESTALVICLAAYLKMAQLTAESQAIVQTYWRPINRDIQEIQPVLGILRRIFASAGQKKAADAAYQDLCERTEGGYQQRVEALLSELEGVEALSGAEAWREFQKHPIEFYNVLETMCPGLLATDDEVCGLPDELAQEVERQSLVTEGLNCQLRRYQEWGVKYILHQERVLLGDEMGLGKTVQAIAAMVSLKNAGERHFLVICPAAVIENWCREIRRHSTLEVVKIHGQDRQLAFQNWLKTGGAAVTTYETTKFLRMPDEFQMGMLVVDEAHYIKNPEAQRSIRVKKICTCARRILFMTGTALENKVDEMISLISILRPELSKKLERMASLSAAPQFREEIAPVYYRRKRDDVLKELPDLIETCEWCELNPEEEKIYEKAVLGRRYALARRVSWNVKDPSESSKGARLLELAEEAKEEGRKVIVFSFFLDTLEKVHTLVGEACLPIINGSVPPDRRQEIVDEFDESPAGTVLAAQIQAGGTGLNIQSASVVILCEPQFKPSLENQAISRAYRMGQTRNVLVYRLLAEDTVDEKIMKILAEKQGTFDVFADPSVAAEVTFELDNASFSTMIDEEIARIEAKIAAGKQIFEDEPRNP